MAQEVTTLATKGPTGCASASQDVPDSPGEHQGTSSIALCAALGATLLSCPAEELCPHRCPRGAEPHWDIKRYYVPQHGLGRGLGGSSKLSTPQCFLRMQLSPLQLHLPMGHTSQRLSTSDWCSCSCWGQAAPQPHSTTADPRGPSATEAAFNNPSRAQLREDKHQNPCMLPRGEREAKQQDKWEL